jgi:hypothetical protein
LEFVDAFLKIRKNARYVASDVPYLSAGAFWCNRIWSPSSDASWQWSSAAPPIEIRELPFQAPILHSVMSWHRRFDDVPAHRWLRSTIIGIAATL